VRYSVYDNAAHYKNVSEYAFAIGGISTNTLATVVPSCDVRLLSIANNNNSATEVTVLAHFATLDAGQRTVVDAKLSAIVQESAHTIACKVISQHAQASYRDDCGRIQLGIAPHSRCDVIVAVAVGSRAHVNTVLQSLSARDIMQVAYIHNPNSTPNAHTLGCLAQMMYQRSVDQHSLQSYGILSTRPLLVYTVQGQSVQQLERDLAEVKKLSAIRQQFGVVIFYNQEHKYHSIMATKINQVVDSLDFGRSQIPVYVLNKATCEVSLVRTIMDRAINLKPYSSTEIKEEQNVRGHLPSYIDLLYSTDCKICTPYQLQCVSDGAGYHDGALVIADVGARARYYNHLLGDGMCAIVDEYGATDVYTDVSGAQTGIAGASVGSAAASPRLRLVGYTQYVTQGIVIGESMQGSPNTMWSPSLGVCDARNTGADYSIRHGMGWSEYECQYNDIVATQLVSMQSDALLYELQICNTATTTRELDIMYFVQPHLLQDSAINIEESGDQICVTDTNGRSMYITSSQHIESMSCYKESIVNRYGAIRRCARLDDSGGVVPCVAISSTLHVPAHSQRVARFWLSTHPDLQMNSDIIGQTDKGADSNTDKQGKGAFGMRLHTTDAQFDNFVNWLPHRIPRTVTACSLHAAWGLLYIDHSTAKACILHTAAQNSLCVYTSLSLVLYVDKYVEVSGDNSVLEIVVAKGNTLLQHCKCVIDNACIFDKNGLVVGDKQDVLLHSMMLVLVLRRFAKYWPHATYYDMQVVADTLSDSINKVAWSDRYVLPGKAGTRAKTDNKQNAHADIVVQSLAVLSGVADRQRASIVLGGIFEVLDLAPGMPSMLSKSVHCDESFWQNTDKMVTTASLVEHDALVWLVQAHLHHGQADRAFDIIRSINPVRVGGKSASIFGRELQGWWGNLLLCVLEHMVGVQLRGGILKLQPQLPSVLHKCSVDINVRGVSLTVAIDNSTTGEYSMSIDGVSYNVKGVPITPSLDAKTIIMRKTYSQ
jgi:hypothetical protein